MTTVDEAIAACRSWTPQGFVTLYDWLMKDSGFGFPDHLYPLVLALCDTRIRKLMLIIGPGSGKSLCLSIVYPTSLLGKDPTQTAICISGAENLAQGFQNTVMRFIEAPGGPFQQIYPEVRPDKSGGWSTTAGMFVTGRRQGTPDASYWAAGINSTAITGKHGSLLIFDDLHDEQNSATEDQCQAVVRKYAMQLAGRADPMGARMIMAGRRWHEKDLYGTLKNNGDWVVLTLPAERPNSKFLYYDAVVPDDLDCVFTDGMLHLGDGSFMLETDRVPIPVSVSRNPETGIALRHIQWRYGIDPKSQGFFWPGSDHKRSEYFTNKRLAPSETEAVYQCDPGAKRGSVFTDDDFMRRYEAPEGLANGPTSPAIKEFLSRGAFLIQAWDTAFSAKTTSDWTVGVTLMLVPCTHYHRDEDPAVLGPCEPHMDVYVLDVFREKLPYAGVTVAMRTLYQRWQPAYVVIEKKAYGVVAVEALQTAGMPIDPVTPGPLESKRARAVEGLSGGSVQGWCRQWRVLLPMELPKEHNWLPALLRELKDFTGAEGSTDDQVDSLVHGVRWAISHGGAAMPLPEGWDDPDQIDAMMQNEPKAMQPGFAVEDVVDPFGTCCGRCRHFVRNARAMRIPTNLDLTKVPADYCVWRNRATVAIDSCEDFADLMPAISFPVT